MRSYSLLAPAKINLYLEIIGSRPDGFHELAMVLQSINLCDQINIRSLGTDTIRVHCQHKEVPSDQTNLAYRAATLLAQQFPDAYAQYGGVEIVINKQIPVAAGLAGGSTDAAGVLVGIDLLWKLGLTQSELQELGAKLGSDVPFCIGGGTALATGRGEILSPLPDLDNLYVVLAKYRHLGISTVWSYQTYREKFSHTYLSNPEDLQARLQRVHSSQIVNAITQKNSQKIGELLHNDLEKVALPVYPQIVQLREMFEKVGVLGTLMSGSGPTVFALAESQNHAESVKNTVSQTLNHPDLEFWIAQFCPTGITLAIS